MFGCAAGKRKKEQSVCLAVQQKKCKKEQSARLAVQQENVWINKVFVWM